jgi:hypothetical protein
MPNQPNRPQPQAARAAAPAARPAQAAAMPAKQQAMAAASRNASAATADEEEEEDLEPASGNRSLMMAVPSWLVSLVVHVVLLTMLGLMYFNLEDPNQKTVIVARPPDQAEEIEEFTPDIPDPVDVVADPSEDVPQVMTQDVVIPVTDVVSTALDTDAAMANIELSEFGAETAPRKDLAKEIGAMSGTGLSGRGAAARGKMVQANGGNAASEAAVAAALKWLAAHQRPDGSWSFDHRNGPCKTNPGSLAESFNGATGMALLPFLGAGQTHKEGNYKQTVKGGLSYLVRSMKLKNGNAGDLTDRGTMYTHGICSIVLCEAYAMTNDRELMVPAQAAINYIVYAQDPVGGGWRYQPKQAGDTSVVGWQLMALKSGHMAYLNVPPATVKGASVFLDSVQSDSGSAYGYTNPGNGAATSAVGLLSRMYLGWKKDNGALQRGVERMSKAGPSKGNMYFNYYATQIMRHYGGEEWTKWNNVMRDQMVNSQAKDGAEKGSWYIPGDHGSERGGRIYCTSMATMILEVYYRHMPIYGKAAAEEDFPL